MPTKIISLELSKRILNTLKEGNFLIDYEKGKHSVVIHDAAGNDWAHLRLPLTLPYIDSEEEDTNVSYVILLIQSGSCALGYFEGGVHLEHKIFRAYMVRKKQGKSQIKYLKTKGKSKAGSRVRLGEAREFFENINERLQEYFEYYKVGRIAMSCSKTLLPFFYQSKTPPPFDKKDERILKIPKHVHLPSYEVMMEVNEFLLKGELRYEEQHEERVQQLLSLTKQ